MWVTIRTQIEDAPRPHPRQVTRMFVVGVVILLLLMATAISGAFDDSTEAEPATTPVHLTE